MSIGYCMHCRAEREVVNGTQVQTKGNATALDGQCAVCGTRLYLYVKKETA